MLPSWVEVSDQEIRKARTTYGSRRAENCRLNKAELIPLKAKRVCLTYSCIRLDADPT